MKKHYPGDEKPSLDELTHFGVKGMKWGVKKAYTDRVTKQTAFVSRVAEGKGSKLDRTRAGLYTPVGKLVRKNGVQNHAKAVDAQIKSHLDRINTGKKTIRDTLTMYGHVTLGDVVKGAKLAKQAPR